MTLGTATSWRWLGLLVVLGLATAAWSPASAAADRHAPASVEPDGVAFWNPRHGLLIETVTAASCRAGSSRCLGGRVASTTDGGPRWRTVDQVPFPLRAVAVAPGGSAWIEVGRCSAASPDACATSLLLVSADGGIRWSEVRSDEAVSSVSPVSATTAWAVAAGSEDRPGRLLYTRDGGRRWQLEPTPCTQYRGLGTWAVDFPTRGRGWVMCVSEPATDMQAKALYRTVDAGRSWQLQAASSLFPGEGRVPRGTGALDLIGYLPGFDFTDRRYGWVWAYRQGLSATQNAGRSWHRIAATVVDDDANEVLAGSVLPDGTGYLLIDQPLHAARYGPELLGTTDDGLTWRTLRVWASS